MRFCTVQIAPHYVPALRTAHFNCKVVSHSAQFVTVFLDREMQRICTDGSCLLDSRNKVLCSYLQGVMEMHAAGWAHLDLKPDNACLEIADGRLLGKLIDFGSAYPLGTSEYMATSAQLTAAVSMQIHAFGDCAASCCVHVLMS